MTILLQILDLAAVDRFFNEGDDVLPFIRRLKQDYMIIKYSDLVKRIGECMILYDWDFSKIAEYLLLSKSERGHCINIMDIEACSLEEAVKGYFGNYVIYTGSSEVIEGECCKERNLG